MPELIDPEWNLLLVAAALGLEWLIGYPAPLLRAVGHPVMWIGGLIARLDRAWNRHTMPEAARRLNGVAALVVLLVVAIVPAACIQALLMAGLPYGGFVVLALLATSLLAQDSLARHVRAVADGLERDGLAAGRMAVARIVGRDPNVLDGGGVARAAIESLAENFSDAVVAPALWCAAGGLPGIAAYKAVNTADSMIGHRTPRHRAFGWAAARFDDLINLPASRLAAGWLVLAALVHPRADGRAAWRAVRRDAGRHRSPNAGWPEAAMAGALGLKLAGPRIYGTVPVIDAWMGDGNPAAGPADIRRALALYRIACLIQLAVYAGLAACVLIGR